MARERIDKQIQEIRKLLKEKKLLIGADRTLKELKLGNIEKVFLAVNCSDKVKEDMKRYSKLSKVSISRLKYPSEELGILCKKPFSISVLGLVKGSNK